jgi:hypothetical protein
VLLDGSSSAPAVVELARRIAALDAGLCVIVALEEYPAEPATAGEEVRFLIKRAWARSLLHLVRRRSSS